MNARRNISVKGCHILRLRTCRSGYRLARESLGLCNHAVRSAYETGSDSRERRADAAQGYWLGRCSFWRARLRWSINHVEDLLGRPRLV